MLPRISNIDIPLAPLCWLVLLCLPLACTPAMSVRDEAETHYHQGQILASRGEHAEATEQFNRSLLLARQADFKPGIAHNLNELAILHTASGDTGKARSLLMQSLSIYRELGMKTEISKTMNNIALTHIREKNPGKALQQFGELLDWDRRIGNQLGEAITLHNMSLIYRNNLHNEEEAARLLTKSRNLFEKLDETDYIKKAGISSQPFNEQEVRHE